MLLTTIKLLLFVILNTVVIYMYRLINIAAVKIIKYSRLYGRAIIVFV